MPLSVFSETEVALRSFPVDDVIFVGSGVVLLLVCRHFLVNRCFNPLGRKMLGLDATANPSTFSKADQTDLSKFDKYCWHGMCYAAFIFWGWSILTSLDWWRSSASIPDAVTTAWTDYPHGGPEYAEEKQKFRNYMLAQLAWYSHGVVESLVIGEPNRGDYWMLMLHHFLAVTMISGAWYNNAFRVGALVCCEQDPADVAMYVGKLVQKCKTVPSLSKERRPWLHTLLLLNVVVSWFCTRVLFLGTIVYKMWTILPREFLFDPINGYLMCFLSVFLTLQIVWFAGLAKMFYDQQMTGSFHDMWNDAKDKKEKKKE